MLTETRHLSKDFGHISSKTKIPNDNLSKECPGQEERHMLTQEPRGGVGELREGDAIYHISSKKVDIYGHVLFQFFGPFKVTPHNEFI